MKTLTYLILISFMTVLSQTNLKIKDQDLYFDESDGYWAVFTKDGIQLTEYYGNFTPVFGKDTKFYNGYALVKMYNSSNEMGYINSNGQLLNSFDALGYAKEFNEGYASYRKLSNLKFGIIDNKGTTILPFEYDDVTTVCHKRAFVKKNNKWGLYDVENKKFITDFKYDLLIQIYNEHRDYFTRMVQVTVNHEKFLLDITNGVETKITGDPSQKIPINRGDYLAYIQNDTKVLEHAFKPEKKLFIKNHSEYNDYIDIYNSELLILTKRKRLPYNHPEYDNAYALANNKGEIIFSDAYGYNFGNNRYYITIDFNQTPRFIRYCKKDKEGKLKFGIIDMNFRKVIISHNYDKIELIDQKKLLFGAKIKDQCFLLDSNGTDRLSEQINFNALPYYINREKNFCIASNNLPIEYSYFKKRNQFYLYDLNGNLLLKDMFYDFELINNQKLKLYHFNDDISLLDMNTFVLKNSFGYKKIKPISYSFRPIFKHETEENIHKEIVNQKGKTILKDVITYIPLYGSYYLFQIKGDYAIYNLNEYKPKSVFDAVLEHTEINDSLHIIYFREKHTLKRGIYDFKNNVWLKIKINNKEFDFSPNENNRIYFVMNQLIYFKLNTEPNFYFLDFNTNEIKNYDYIPLNCIMNGRVNVKFNDGSLGYIDIDGKVLFKCRKNVIENFPFYKNTALIRVKENNKEFYEIIDTLGNKLAGGPEFVKYSYERINNYNNLNLSKECELNRFSINNDKSSYTKIEQLSNGKIGIRTGMNWSKYFEETGKTFNQTTCNKKCYVCKGTCSYIYQESCDYCTGGIVYEGQTSEVIRLGGVSTTTVGGNVITKYESPVIYTKTISRKCSVCNGTGDKPGSNIEFRKCWKCRPK